MDFIQSFIRYGMTRSDSPPAFWAHAAMATLGAAMGNKVHTAGWTRPIYPNLWIALIAPSGYAKSAPLDLAENLLRRAHLGRLLMPNSGSREGFLVAFSNEPNEVFIRQELSNLIAETQKGYNEGMMQDLTEWYDVPESVTRRLVKEENSLTINRPCPTILSASTPAWIQKDLSAALEGGFLARFIYCPSFESGEYVGDPGPASETVEAELARHVSYVAGQAGVYDLSPVSGTYTAWERPLRLSRDSWDPTYAGMYNRMPALVKKATMIIGMARHPNNMVATEEDLGTAIQYVERSTEAAVAYLRSARGTEEYAEAMRIVGLVKRAGGSLSHHDLLDQFKGSLRRFNAAVDLAEQTRRLVVNRGETHPRDTVYLTKEN